MNDDQWADAIDKMVTGLEQYNATIHALSKKSTNDTQPLRYQVPEEAPYQAYDKPITSNEWWEKEQSRLLEAARSTNGAWEELVRQRREEQVKQPPEQDALGMMQEAYEHIHVHGPFVFLMNQNHNALRGCVTCGATWVGLMAGSEESLCWHPVGELPEEEE